MTPDSDERLWLRRAAAQGRSPASAGLKGIGQKPSAHTPEGE